MVFEIGDRVRVNDFNQSDTLLYVTAVDAKDSRLLGVAVEPTLITKWVYSHNLILILAKKVKCQSHNKLTSDAQTATKVS